MISYMNNCFFFNFSIRREQFEEYSKIICEVFPTEQEFRYFNYTDDKQHSGKLISQYVTLREKYKKVGLINKRNIRVIPGTNIETVIDLGK